jgi:hypothetical protein
VIAEAMVKVAAAGLELAAQIAAPDDPEDLVASWRRNPWRPLANVMIQFVTPRGALEAVKEHGWTVVSRRDPLYKQATRRGRRWDRKRRPGGRVGPHGKHRILVAKPVYQIGGTYLPRGIR